MSVASRVTRHLVVVCRGQRARRVHAAKRVDAPLLAAALSSAVWLGSCGAAYRTDRGHAELVAPVAIAERRAESTPPARTARVSEASAPAASSTGTATGAAGDAPVPAATGRGGVPAAPAGASAAPADEGPPATGFAPDPEPLVQREHFELELRYERGEIQVAGARPITTAKPVATPRKMGRFAFELWIGRELIDRVRFDFPLLGAEPAPAAVQPLDAPPSFAQGAVVSRSIQVPDSARATSARIVDRATGATTPVAWPPSTASDPRIGR